MLCRKLPLYTSTGPRENAARANKIKEGIEVVNSVCKMMLHVQQLSNRGGRILLGILVSQVDPTMI